MKYAFLLLFLPLMVLAQDHLLITEALAPPDADAGKAFVEIYNPTGQNVDLSDYYLANYNTYYQIVSGTYSQNTIHFVSRFPSMNMAAGQALAIALRGSEFKAAFGQPADLEINASDASTTDMIGINVGSNPTLENARGMVVLFRWDGQSDLVQDVDYLPWGLVPFNSYWMDKTGVSIDGPDSNSDNSTYLADLTRSQQKAPTAPSDGQSLQRDGLTETAEIQTGGNGITGHNEASEDWTQSFISGAPTPGVYSENPGDGTGTAILNPKSFQNGVKTDLTLDLTGSAGFTLASVQITLPEEISWSQSSDDVALSGGGLQSATVSVDGNSILLEQTELTDTQTGTVSLSGITMPASKGTYVIGIRTAVSGGVLTPIPESPSFSVYETMTIEEARKQPVGTEVTIQGVVTIGAGILRTNFTDAYMQDASGYGINIYKSNGLDPLVERGNQLLIKGSIAEYQGKIEITNYTVTLLDTGQTVPGVRMLKTGEASSLQYDGSFVRVIGFITNISYAGGGTTIYMDDGTGEVAVRVWDTAGLDLSGFAKNDFISVYGVISGYRGTGQLLVGYQSDIGTPEYDGTPAYLKVEPHPFVPDRGESINIEFSAGAQNTHVTLRIFDMGGRLVTTLKDGDGLPLPMDFTWNGRDELNEFVPLGTYICHLEVIDKDTGKRTLKIAPIVIGTVLK